LKSLVFTAFYKNFSVIKTLLYFKTHLKTAAKPINTGLTAVFNLLNCQRRDYTQLDPKDKKVFTKKIGIGTLLVSIGILVMPIINLISHSELGYYIGLILIVVGVFYIIFIIVKYNGKLISFKK
jgi:hypothetical protein